MSKYKSLIRREHIAAVAHKVAQVLTDLLTQAGIPFRLKVQQSKRTGSVYLNVHVYAPDGRRLKGLGCSIRIADHSKHDSRWANFSRPAKRAFGVWCFSSPWKIVGKVNRIGRRLLDRVNRQAKGGEA